VNSTLPVPVEFELPGPEWTPADPTAYGVTNAAFLAVRTPLGDDYVPTLVISGDERFDPATIRDIAEEAVAVLAEQTPHLRILHREQVGADTAPAVTQLVAVGVEIDGRPLDLLQMQVITALVDLDDPRRRVVVIYKVTCLAEDWPRVGREFQDFMRTVRPLPEQTDPETAPEG
jgi:hypothetical protein